MNTGKWNISIQCGESVNRQFKLLSATGEPFDLTGYTLESQVRAEYNSPSASAEFTVTSSLPTEGLIIMTMPASSSAQLTGSCYYYDVRMTSGSIVQYPFEGKLVVSPRVTR
jgi:hypothetical protein